ncbi:hypothetical protein RZS08_19830, partial [Arthrospira platensis SPKY1]|nr:hypothetical protein [Arthrospira platensis SPKY1]
RHLVSADADFLRHREQCDPAKPRWFLAPMLQQEAVSIMSLGGRRDGREIAGKTDAHQLRRGARLSVSVRFPHDHQRAGSPIAHTQSGPVAQDLHGIPKADARRILARIETLWEDPRPPGSEKLSSQERYRVRQGNYR